MVERRRACNFARMRTGFSLVELLVAIVVLTIGVLGLAATAGLVAAHVGDGAQLTGGAHAARSVLDSLGTVPCARLSSGTTRRSGVAVQWSVAQDSVAASVEVAAGSVLRRGTRRDVYRAVVPCGRA